ncbi:MAG: hypothetical protein JWN73_934 [Betaproteobacteria bacterium]|nr:hypothetical protein [Betaproteobacteria bacterium]
MDETEAIYDSNERGWGAMAHLSALAGLIIPFGNLLGPLVVWLVKRRDSDLADSEGKEALNFQITITLSLLLCIPALFIGIGGKLFLLIWIANLFFIIKAGVHAAKGENYSYPLTMRFIG